MNPKGLLHCALLLGTASPVLPVVSSVYALPNRVPSRRIPSGVPTDRPNRCLVCKKHPLWCLREKAYVCLVCQTLMQLVLLRNESYPAAFAGVANAPPSEGLDLEIFCCFILCKNCGVARLEKVWGGGAPPHFQETKVAPNHKKVFQQLTYRMFGYFKHDGLKFY